ncbi:hypothetical protein OROGR_010527 [Orobanche gracilis]
MRFSVSNVHEFHSATSVGGSHIEKEQIFTDISQRHAAAIFWDKKAKHLIATKARISDFEDLLRACEHIRILPSSLFDVKLAVSTARAWLTKSKPFLHQDSPTLLASDTCLRVDDLKELALESEDLNVHLEEFSLLEKVLNKSLEWEQHASTLLQNAEHLWDTGIEGILSFLIPRLECQVLLMETAIKSGISLGLEFNMIPKLQDACATFKWCITALSFSTTFPTHKLLLPALDGANYYKSVKSFITFIVFTDGERVQKISENVWMHSPAAVVNAQTISILSLVSLCPTKDVEMILSDAASLPVINKSVALWTALVEGLSWLKKSLEILGPSSHGKYQVSSVEEVIVLSKFMITIMINRLWREQVQVFFGLSFEDRSLYTLIELKEHGSSKAFSCVELETVLFEHEKIQNWKQRCTDMVKPPSAEDSLLSGLTDYISLLRDLLRCTVVVREKNPEIYAYAAPTLLRIKNFYRVLFARTAFHVQCAETSSEDAVFMVCKYCDFISTSKLTRSGCGPLRTGRKHLSLDKLTVLLADSNDLCLWIDERRILHQIVEKAIACNACLTELANFALAHSSNDLHEVTPKICIALKAIDAAGITDHEGSRKFELAFARTSWKIRAVKLLESAENPTFQQIQIHLKEGLGLNIPPEDYFTQKLTELRKVALQWAETAKKVSMDGGVLGLDKVFELIWEGQSLPVSCEKELKLLRDRSMLYCICRRPYDHRAMIACDKCDEWYHFDCIKISSAPKIYICPACDPHPRETMFSSAPTIVESVLLIENIPGKVTKLNLPTKSHLLFSSLASDTLKFQLVLEKIYFPLSPIEEGTSVRTRLNGNNFEEPQTPLRCSELKRNSKTSKPFSKNDETREEIDLHDCLTRFSSNGKLLLWRNRKPFRRATRKRSQLQSLSILPCT